MCKGPGAGGQVGSLGNGKKPVWLKHRRQGRGGVIEVVQAGGTGARPHRARDRCGRAPFFVPGAVGHQQELSSRGK